MPIFALDIKRQTIMEQRIYPIGIQNFEKLRMDCYVYVDKTAIVHRLVTTGSYWFATGTPSYLVHLLKKHRYRLENIEGVEVTEDVLNSIDSESTNPIPVIYQSGYLTIKDYDSEFKLYQLGYPNQEVEEGFLIQWGGNSSRLG